MVGFHLMKVSSCSASVMPPKTPTMTSDTHSIGSTRRWRSHTQAICATVVAMATVVAT